MEKRARAPRPALREAGKLDSGATLHTASVARARPGPHPFSGTPAHHHHHRHRRRRDRRPWRARRPAQGRAQAGRPQPGAASPPPGRSPRGGRSVNIAPMGGAQPGCSYGCQAASPRAAAPPTERGAQQPPPPSNRSRRTGQTLPRLRRSPRRRPHRPRSAKAAVEARRSRPVRSANVADALSERRRQSRFVFLVHPGRRIHACRGVTKKRTYVPGTGAVLGRDRSGAGSG